MYNSNKKINIKDFFKKIENLNYVLVKKPENFPDYYQGSDLDIFCDNKKTLIQQILIEGNKYVENYDYEIKVSSNEETKHTKVDFFLNNEIDIRFDIHEGLPNFKKIEVRKDYIYSLLNNKQKFEIKNDVFVYIPSDIDELILRYIEYFERFEKRPDKVKHLDYIEKYIGNDDNKKEWLNRLHQYIKMTDDDISKPEKKFANAKITKTDIKTKIKRELKYRIPLIYKILMKIKRLIKN